MKILFVAVFNYNSTNLSQADGFKKNGHELVEFNYREYAEKNGSLRRNNEIIRITKDENIDVVVFSKCNEITSDVVIECNKYAKTILWYMDPVNGNFNASLIEKIKLCNYTYCALWNSYFEAKKYGDNVYFLHEGYDHTSNYPIDMLKCYDVTFIGQLRNHRYDYYKSLNFKLIDNAYGKEHSIAVSQSKINLNFTEGGTSDRTYKVLASKGFLLTEPWVNMEKDFIVGHDLDIFTSVNELAEKIEFYLKNEDKRNKIAENGYLTVQKFDRINWAKKILEYV